MSFKRIAQHQEMFPTFIQSGWSSGSDGPPWRGIFSIPVRHRGGGLLAPIGAWVRFMNRRLFKCYYVTDAGWRWPVCNVACVGRRYSRWFCFAVISNMRVYGKQCLVSGLPSRLNANQAMKVASADLHTLAASCRKRNVTVWRSRVRLSVGIGYSPWSPEAACDAANVHFDPTIQGTLTYLFLLSL